MCVCVCVCLLGHGSSDYQQVSRSAGLSTGLFKPSVEKARFCWPRALSLHVSVSLFLSLSPSWGLTRINGMPDPSKDRGPDPNHVFPDEEFLVTSWLPGRNGLCLLLESVIDAMTRARPWCSVAASCCCCRFYRNRVGFPCAYHCCYHCSAVLTARCYSTVCDFFLCWPALNRSLNCWGLCLVGDCGEMPGRENIPHAQASCF